MTISNKRYKLYASFIFWKVTYAHRPKKSSCCQASQTSNFSTRKTSQASPSSGGPKSTVEEKASIEKPVKVKKPKLVRDSFTIPKEEYTVLANLKQRAGQLGSPAKKSELLRAGIKALAAMQDVAFMAALKVVPSIKTGRPAKD